MKACICLGPSRIRKCTLNLGGKRAGGHAVTTSVTLEPAFWDVLTEMAGGNKRDRTRMLQRMRSHASGNFSSHLRLKCLEYVKTKAAARQTERQSVNAAA